MAVPKVSKTAANVAPVQDPWTTGATTTQGIGANGSKITSAGGEAPKSGILKRAYNWIANKLSSAWNAFKSLFVRSNPEKATPAKAKESTKRLIQKYNHAKDKTTVQDVLVELRARTGQEPAAAKFIRQLG